MTGSLKSLIMVDMRLLVTGGAGFIGSNFIRYWLGAHPDDTIVNFDALTYAGNLENLRDIEGKANYSFVKGDVTDAQAVEQAMRGVEVVVHFAAESHVDRSILEPAAFIKTNILGTYTLLEAARQAGVKRFHHVSTDEVFGSLELDEPREFNESTLLQPNSPYSASKAGSDLLVRAYFKTYGLPVTISNTSNNYGPYQFPEKIIPLMIIKALRDEKLPVYGDGKNVRDWLHFADHCRAIDLIVTKGKPGETYCVGGSNQIANIDLIKKILDIMGKDESLIEFVGDRPGHDRRYAIDSSKIERELDFRPEYDFETGLKQTVQWYIEHQDWWQSVMNKDYLDYYQKQYNNR